MSVLSTQIFTESMQKCGNKLGTIKIKRTQKSCNFRWHIYLVKIFILININKFFRMFLIKYCDKVSQALRNAWVFKMEIE